MTLLALDTGTKMGHAIKDAKIISGVKEFKKSKNDEIGKIYARFDMWLDVVHKTFPDLEAVYYEKVYKHGGSKGGKKFDEENMCVCCNSCNQKKADKDSTTFKKRFKKKSLNLPPLESGQMASVSFL